MSNIIKTVAANSIFPEIMEKCQSVICSFARKNFFSGRGEVRATLFVISSSLTKIQKFGI